MRGNEPLSAAEAESLLQWWSDAGVDCLVGETQCDWLRAKQNSKNNFGDSLLNSRAGRGELSDAGRAELSKLSPKFPESPEFPDQLELFHGFLATDESLPFAAPGAPRVGPAGDPASGLMMLTDMPSSEDCRAGSLLSGRAGSLFDRMLEAIGRNRGSIYLASLSCLRPAGGSFNGDSAARCVELAQHHVGLAAPKVLLVLGDAAAKALFGLSVIQARGRWHDLSTPAGDIATLVSFHPSYLLEQPAAKRHAWADLQMLRERLEA